jgi:hypothetical protein
LTARKTSFASSASGNITAFKSADSFAADGRHLATANGNGTVYILRIPPPPAK